MHGPRNQFAILVIHQNNIAEFLAAQVDGFVHQLHIMALYYHECVLEKLNLQLSKRCHLTPRERECLMLTRNHLTASQISETLGIKLLTVSFHIENAINKLEVFNKFYAIRTAEALGLI